MPRLPSSSLPNCPAPDPPKPDVVSLRPIVNQVNRFLHHSFPGRKCSRKTRRGKPSTCLLIRRTATSEPFRPPPILSSRKPTRRTTSLSASHNKVGSASSIPFQHLPKRDFLNVFFPRNGPTKDLLSENRSANIPPMPSFSMSNSDADSLEAERLMEAFVPYVREEQERRHPEWASLVEKVKKATSLLKHYENRTTWSGLGVVEYADWCFYPEENGDICRLAIHADLLPARTHRSGLPMTGCFKSYKKFFVLSNTP